MTSAAQQIAAREEAKTRAARIRGLCSELAKEELGIDREPCPARIRALKFTLSTLGVVCR